MHEDTKFKIINMEPGRDLIHYVWARVVTLAGKVNLEGGLYMSDAIIANQTIYTGSIYSSYIVLPVIK